MTRHLNNISPWKTPCQQNLEYELQYSLQRYKTHHPTKKIMGYPGHNIKLNLMVRFLFWGSEKYVKKQLHKKC